MRTGRENRSAGTWCPPGQLFVVLFTWARLRPTSAQPCRSGRPAPGPSHQGIHQGQLLGGKAVAGAIVGPALAGGLE
jgi:hypothetical protein